MHYLKANENTGALTMTSREIAEVVGSRHDKVKQSIERLSVRGVIGSPPSVEYRDSLNRAAQEFQISKRDSYVVVARISPAHIGKIADVWGRTEATLDELIEALGAFDVPVECAGMYVYAILESGTGRIKLGISRNPKARLKQLQTGNSSTLELVATRRAGNFKDESEVHSLNSGIHIRGEWFSPGASLDGPVSSISMEKVSA